MRTALLGRARALQHRRGRVRQAPARQARDDPRGPRRQRPRARLGRAAGHVQPVREPARRAGRQAGDRVAMLLPPTPETAAAFLGTWKTGAILLSMSVLYGDDGIKHRLNDSQAAVVVTNDRQPRARRGPDGGHGPRAGRPRRRARRTSTPSTRRRRPGAALLHLRHDRPGEGHPARPPLHPRPQRVRLLPRRPGRRALPRHGRVGVGRRHLAAHRPVALRRRAGRAAAQGRLRPARAARVPLAATARRTSSARRRRSAR